MREALQPAGGPEDVGHACVTTGRRGFSIPPFLSSYPSESEYPGVFIN